MRTWNVVCEVEKCETVSSVHIFCSPCYFADVYIVSMYNSLHETNTQIILFQFPWPMCGGLPTFYTQLSYRQPYGDAQRLFHLFVFVFQERYVAYYEGCLVVVCLCRIALLPAPTVSLKTYLPSCADAIPKHRTVCFYVRVPNLTKMAVRFASWTNVGRAVPLSIALLWVYFTLKGRYILYGNPFGDATLLEVWPLVPAPRVVSSCAYHGKWMSSFKCKLPCGGHWTFLFPPSQLRWFFWN